MRGQPPRNPWGDREIRLIATVWGSGGLKPHGSSNSACSTKQASSNYRDLLLVDGLYRLRLILSPECIEAMSARSAS